MDNKIISSWIRQARYRANKRNIYTELSITDVQQIVEDFDGNCAYCEAKAETLDHPFPIKESAPNIPANVLPSCKKCKTDKKANDIVWLFMQGKLEKPKYLTILKSMFSRSGGDTIKKHVQTVTGIHNE
jgi:hypothetical protein